MNKYITSITLSAILLAVSSAGASEFAGSYLGGKLGVNSSDFNGPAVVNGVAANLANMSSKDATVFGLEGGRNWDMSSYLLGVDFFIDSNEKATHTVSKSGVAGSANFGSTVYGLDLKLGLPNGYWMPYAKLGYGSGKSSGDFAVSGNGIHAGLGVEYKFSPHWSVLGELSTHAADGTNTKLNNNNFTIGVNYFFRVPKAAPVIAAAEPVAVPKPEPIPEPKAEPAPPPPAPVPVPQLKESWKIIKEQKPVVIEGANFDFDSSKLRPTAAAKLQPVVDFANKYPDAGIDVHGYTSSVGAPAYNQKLSERRAESVKAYLVSKGIDASRITTKGYGETEPVADNKTREGRAANRRVEVHYVIMEEKKVRVVK